MSLPQTLHSPLPVFGWDWWQILIFVFVCDWLMMRLLQRIDFRRYKFEVGKTSLYGDMFLPFGVASTVRIAQQSHNPNVWYASLWWNVAILLSGIAIHFYIRYMYLYKKLRKTTIERQRALSVNWHSLVLVLLYYMIGVTIIPAIVIHKPAYLVALMVVGYGGWLTPFIYDVLNLYGIFAGNKQKQPGSA
jgi:hypothetical protein